jgi:hypothetical protein
MSEAFNYGKLANEINERSKFDKAIIVGSEIRQAIHEAYEAGQNQAQEEVNELKRKLFNEGVKNNSDKARVEFLEDKLEEVEKVIEAAKVLAVHLRKGGYTGMMFQDVLKAVDELDSEWRKW